MQGKVVCLEVQAGLPYKAEEHLKIARNCHHGSCSVAQRYLKHVSYTFPTCSEISAHAVAATGLHLGASTQICF